jgi:hypothetical protein
MRAMMRRPVVKPVAFRSAQPRPSGLVKKSPLDTAMPMIDRRGSGKEIVLRADRRFGEIESGEGVSPETPKST